MVGLMNVARKLELRPRGEVLLTSILKKSVVIVSDLLLYKLAK